MSKIDSAIVYFRQFLLALVSWEQSWHFVKEHQPWKGLKEYGWITKIVVVGAIIFGFQFFVSLFSWVTNLGTSQQALGLTSTVSSFYQDVAVENFKWIFSGGSKYLILILLEVLVFHFTRFTLAYLTGEKSDSTFDAFVKAEIRMIKVAIRCWVLETIIIAIMGVGLGIFGMGGLKEFFGFFVQCYFLGYAMIDNYFECYGATIKESSLKILEVAGATIGIGIVAYGLMYVPLVGVVLATTFGAVAGTMTIYKLMPPDTLQFEAQIV
ncbi:MAG: hypothetical protein NXI23_19155 [Bacteroidetes bacterium]|jgi:CysZ protein|nr:hypothetical protein [Bacteroidota bacterium]